MDNIHILVLVEISTNKAELVEVGGYSAIAYNYEDANIFYTFALHLFYKFSKKTWNQTVINYHIATLFAMEYIHVMDGQSHI